MKANEQYFPCMLHNVVFINFVFIKFTSVDEFKNVAIKMRAAGQYFLCPSLL